MRTQWISLWLLVKQPTKSNHTNNYVIMNAAIAQPTKVSTHSTVASSQWTVLRTFPRYWLSLWSPRWWNPRMRYNETAGAVITYQDCRDFGSAPLGWLDYSGSSPVLPLNLVDLSVSTFASSFAISRHVLLRFSLVGLGSTCKINSSPVCTSSRTVKNGTETFLCDSQFAPLRRHLQTWPPSIWSHS